MVFNRCLVYSGVRIGRVYSLFLRSSVFWIYRIFSLECRLEREMVVVEIEFMVEFVIFLI